MKRARIKKFPVLFPVSRDFGRETGSRSTASATTHSGGSFRPQKGTHDDGRAHLAPQPSEPTAAAAADSVQSKSRPKTFTHSLFPRCKALDPRRSLVDKGIAAARRAAGGVNGRGKSPIWAVEPAEGRLSHAVWTPKGRPVDENQRQSRFQVEPLEPRILLSGDPVASELARLVDDATHAMFVDDHAAVVEQLKTEIVADAKHADHANQDVVVSGAQAGDERGVAWPSEWSQPNAAENAAVAGKVDLRMAIANLVAAFATKVSVDGAGHGHFVAKVASSGPPTETAPQAITIEFEQDGASSSDVLGSAASSESNSASTATSAKTLDAGVSTSGSEQSDSSAQTDPVQTLLKSVLDQVLAAFAADGNDAIDLAALEGLDIRMASLGPGEVARIDGNVILVDDDAGGAGWSLDNVAATDLATLATAVLADAVSQASDVRPLAGPLLTGFAHDVGPSAAGDGFVVAVTTPTAPTAPATTATAELPPVMASVSSTAAVPDTGAVPAAGYVTTAPAVKEAVTVAPTSVPVEAAPAAEKVSGTAAIAPAEDSAIATSTLSW